MSPRPSDPISSWFIAAEHLGEFIGIRFGHLPLGATQPEWMFLRHTDFDGIGGLAHILRSRGANLPRLPQVKHPSEPSWRPFIRSIPKVIGPRYRVRWWPLEGPRLQSLSTQAPAGVAWHVFDEQVTTDIRRVCRKTGVTVNSFLVKHLTKAIRPYLQDESSMVPWMIPVNLRGKVFGPRDTGNFSSYISINVNSYETVAEIHRNIYKKLACGEHWANWYAYKAGRFAPQALKQRLIAAERCTSQWHIGGFSNLGDWDAERAILPPGCSGDWLFCPPVLRFQKVGAGCVTFQNRLSLTIQTHPELASSPSVTQAWVKGWVKEIEIDLSSNLAEPAVTPSSKRSWLVA